MRDAQSGRRQLVGTLEDVHDRRLAQAALAEAHEQLNAVFTLSDDGFVALGSDGLVTFCSPAFSSLCGIDKEQLLAKGEADMVAVLCRHFNLGGDATCMESFMHDIRRLHRRDAHYAERAVIAVGSEPIRMIEFRLQRGHGRVTQMLHARDVTQEIEVERMKGEFLSTAAHELRTPMTSIYGFVALVLNHSFQEDKRKDLLERVYRQCGSMIQIINELLDLARLEAKGASEFSMGLCDLPALLDEVIKDFKVPEGRAAPVRDWPQESMLISVDEAKAKQAVLNVLSNAYKYSPNGGEVRIRITYDPDRGGSFNVQVSDQGIGMAPDQLPHFGERFFRADRASGIPGTGLGISIVREIMSHMGGNLQVESQVGRGTCVTLNFVAAVGAEASQQV